MAYKTEIFEELRQLLIDEVDGSEAEDAFIMEVIDELLTEKGKEYALNLKTKEELRKDLFYSIRKLDIIQELIDDPDVNEIMINGYENIFFEKHGKIRRFGKKFGKKERLDDIVQQIAGECNRAVSEQSPIADARLVNGDRVNIVLPPVAVDGPAVTIRRFPDEPITMDDLIERDSITDLAADELKELTAAGYTILVSGGTSTGKTTFLNALSQYIPKEERIVTIEDNVELRLMEHENLVRLEAKKAVSNEAGEITIRDLIKTALRMRPTRIIIGEVRGEETADFLTCLNTGHEGSLGSVHANSPEDVILRIESMVRMANDIPIPVIRSQIAAGIEIIVQLYRDIKGIRRVEKISEVTGADGDMVKMHMLYERDIRERLVKKDELQKTAKRDKYRKYLEERTKTKKDIL